ncbi:MAG: phosphatase PAP2 family protein [Negativicutes bacterium]
MKFQKLKLLNMAFTCVLFLSLSAGYVSAATAGATVDSNTVFLKTIKLLPGYLEKTEYIDSLALLPPPPALDSAAFALDRDVARRTFAVRGTARFALALSDYDMNFPNAAGVYSCVLNVPITETDTPKLYMLLRRVLTDAGITTSAAKNHYMRQRPFVSNKQPICAPKTRAHLEKDGSYPSGHTTVGWTWALILAEISPAQADAILARGRAFGENRNVCNHHWYSDVEWGRVIAAATVARLHANAEFRADLEAVRAELDMVRAKGLTPTRDCKAEAAALAIQPY